MKAKSIPCIVLFVVLAMTGSGCCTYRLTKYCRRTTLDTFVPIAVYQATNSGSLALEGRFHREVPKERACALSAQERGGVRRWLLIPEGAWQPENSPTNSGPWHAELKEAWPRLAKDSRFQETLPSGYTNLADLPATFAMLPVAERRHRSAWVVLTPLTAVVDLATSPIQLTVYAIAWMTPPF